jgi:hypothetical protein
MTASQPGPPSCHDAVTPPVLPSRHDGVTTPCPACRALAYRRRRAAAQAAIVIPDPRPRRPGTVYECGNCGHRALGNQRCDQCGTFMRRAGTGGCCPACDEPITITELTGQEAGT